MRSYAKAATPPAAKTLDSSWYLSPDIFARERERIFSHSWICVGRAGSIEGTGDFFTIEVAGESLIVTREGAGGVRAFYNVCRHRGTRLCTQAGGTFVGSIQCPYHAWTYGLDGSLAVARNMNDTPGFDPADYPLREAEVAQWEGFIFVCLDPQEPFSGSFAPVLDRFASWRIEELRAARRIEYDLRCNWKLIFQNYSECYHCPVIHPQLERLSPSDSGRNDLTEGPFLGGYSTLRENRETITGSGHTNRMPLPGLAPEDRSRVYYYTLFPSMLLSLHPDYVMVHYVRPVAAGQTRVVCEWLFHPDAMAQPQFQSEDAVEFWDLTNRQDWRVNELTQLGIASRAYSPGPYSQQEGLLYAFDRHYLNVMAE